LKRKLIIAGIILFALALAAMLLVREEQQFRRASYNGKTAKEWAGELYSTPSTDPSNAAVRAFLEMGSNAVPALRAIISSRDPIYERTFLQQARRIPLGARQYLFSKLQPGRSLQYRLGAVRAVGILGTNAVDALPEMIEIIRDTDSSFSASRWFAAQNISALGEPSIAALSALTTNADPQTRHAAVYALGEARTNALPATVALIHATTDTNDFIRGSAFYSLSRIGRTALPIAIEMAASHPDATLRDAAYRSLIVMLPPPGRVPNALLVSSTNMAEMRRLAVISVGMSRLTNENAMKLIREAAADEDESVRQAAERALKFLNRQTSN
jgi:hypothetical protein